MLFAPHPLLVLRHVQGCAFPWGRALQSTEAWLGFLWEKCQ